MQTQVGNADENFFPHDVFPTRGDDRWIAIAVRDDDDWRALCEAMGRADLRERRDDHALVRDAIAAWTAGQEAAHCEAALQARGVPAHAALDMPGLSDCPQLRSRGHFIEIEHDIFPTTTVESSRLHLSRSSARQPERALGFGRDNRRVLEELLGYDAERIAGLAERGVLI